MNIAMLLALLLASGACARSEFHGPAGARLDVIVCPIMTEADASDDDTVPG